MNRDEVLLGVLTEAEYLKVCHEEARDSKEPWIDNLVPQEGSVYEELVTYKWLKDGMSLVGMWDEARKLGPLMHQWCVFEVYELETKEMAHYERIAALKATFVDWWWNEVDEIREGAYDGVRGYHDFPKDLIEGVAQAAGKRFLSKMVEFIEEEQT